MSEDIKIRKGDWLTLIQTTLYFIDAQKYHVSAAETKHVLDTNPNGFFDFIREKTGEPNWPGSFSKEKETAMAKAMSDADRFGEAIHKMGLENGLTPVIGCAAYYLYFGND